MKKTPEVIRAGQALSACEVSDAGSSKSPAAGTRRSDPERRNAGPGAVGIPLFIFLALMIYGSPAWPVTADEAKQDCLTAVSGAIEAQKAWGKQSYEVANSVMSGITDNMFDLDCINGLALSGGIRFYGPGDLLSLLKQKVCNKINEATGALSKSIRVKASTAHGLFGVDSDAGVNRRVNPQPTVTTRSVDLNGDVAVDSEGVKTRGASDSFHRTLKELFK